MCGPFNPSMRGQERPSKLFQSRSIVLYIGLLVVGFLAAGCNGINPSSTMLPEDEAALAKAPTYTVVMRPVRGREQVFTGALIEPITIQEALEESGAYRRFRHMEIEILRQVPNRPRPITLVADFDLSQQHVSYEQNYAIHPNDQVIVTALPSGPVEQMISSLFR